MKRSNLLALIVIGGLLACTCVANAQVNTWVYVKHMSTARIDPAAATGSDGKIYVFGGIQNFSDPALSSAEAYDPSSDTWSAIGSLPETVDREAAVAMPDGTILIIGGATQVLGGGGGSYNEQVVDAVYSYDPSTDTYTQKASLPTAAFDVTAALGDDGRVYCFEDDGNDVTTTFTSYVYDPVNDSWSPSANPPSGLFPAPTAVMGPHGRIYLAGGDNQNQGDTTAASFSGNADAWTTLPNMIDGRWNLGGALGGDGRVYMVGGRIHIDSTDAVNAYDPSSGTWSTVQRLQTKRGGLACAADAQGRIYAIGGVNPDNVLDSVERFQPSLLNANGVPISSQEGTAFSGTVATLTDAVTSQTSADFTASVDWGDGTSPDVASVAANGGAGHFNVTDIHTYAHFGSYFAKVTINDADGETSTVTDTVTVTDATVTLGTESITAQSGVAFSGTIGTLADANPLAQASDFTATIDWGDGSAISNATVIDDPAGGKFDVNGTHTYSGVGPYSVHIKILEAGGGEFLIHEPADVVAPSAVVTAGHITAVEGANFNGQVATFTDADPNQGLANFTATISWGDGVTSSGTITSNGSGGFNIAGNHTYAEEGSYALVVTVAVTGGLSASSTGSANVADAPLTATGFDLICKGQNFSNTVAAFTDADILGTASDYSASIFWGDGKSSNGTIIAAGSGWKVVGSHSYLKRGKYTVTITIRDVGGATASATTHINVGPVK